MPFSLLACFGTLIYVKRVFLLLLAAFLYLPFSIKPTAYAATKCCPTGFTESAWVCPFNKKTDECCKRIGFSQYELTQKIDCNTVKYNMCNTDTTGKCQSCANEGKVWTAIGCLQTDAQGIISSILPFGIGLAGGVAFLLILFGALQMMTSSGNPEKLNGGKELVGAALMGLLLIIFSVLLLQIIGVNILRIPGFS